MKKLQYFIIFILVVGCQAPEKVDILITHAEVIDVEDNTYVRDYEILTYFMTLANEKGFIDGFNTKKIPDVNIYIRIFTLQY